jgi:ADP-ribose pyrophosphatase YjhB (NUDIX family)
MKKASAVIITNDLDQILLLKRGIKELNEQGKWENMGGEVEEGETFEEAARREAKEELCIELESLEELFTDEDPNGDWMVVIYKAKAVGVPKNMEPGFIDEVRWVSKEQLLDYELASYTRRDFIRLNFIQQ